jgi:hypothetical protein
MHPFAYSTHAWLRKVTYQFAHDTHQSEITDKAKVTATTCFFHRVINGEIPEQFKDMLQQTYLFAPEKDLDNKSNCCLWNWESYSLSTSIQKY